VSNETIRAKLQPSPQGEGELLAVFLKNLRLDLPDGLAKK
jgi:hypothetical protein